MKGFIEAVILDADYDGDECWVKLSAITVVLSEILVVGGEVPDTTRFCVGDLTYGTYEISPINLINRINEDRTSLG